MNAGRILAISLVVTSLAGCGFVDWKSKYAAGEAALAKQPPQLAAAETAFKEAIVAAYKQGVPEPKFAFAFQSLGETLVREGKYGEAQDYLLHTLSLATATHMSADDNVKLFKELISAYECTSNYEQAEQTARAMKAYVEAELSPQSPHYAFALAQAKQFKDLMKSTGADDGCCHKPEVQERRDRDKAKLAAEQPAVLPGAD